MSLPARSTARWVSGLALLLPALLSAQIATDPPRRSPTLRETASHRAAVIPWLTLAVPPGYERIATDVIMRHYPGWTRDGLGNLALRRGSGSPRRVVACELDEPGFVVSAITEDGYLRVHTAGSGMRAFPPWAQFIEGQRIRVMTHRGAVPGVAMVKSAHLNPRSSDTSTTTVADLWIDVGAIDRAAVQALGIRMLDPVAREWPGWTYGADLLAGPQVAQRAGCAAVADASRFEPTRGETIYLLATQGGLSHTGLGAALLRIGVVDTLVIADPQLVRGDSGPSAVRVSRVTQRPFPNLPRQVSVGAMVAIGLRPAHPGTLVETVSEAELAELFAQVAAAAGISDRTDAAAPVTMPPEVSVPPASHPRVGLHVPTARLLGHFANIYGVSGHEGMVRNAVRAQLPAWAQRLATVDSAGNLIVAFGPERDTVVFVAHLDEVGFEVTRIARDGTVTLRSRGGGFPSLWEGQPALLHLDEEAAPPASASAAPGCGAYAGSSLRGIFVPRSTWTTKQPGQLTATFGLDSAALAERGVKPGSSVTAFKCATRLGATGFTARALDDRVGTTALVLALGGLDPGQVRGRTIFAWVTREEIGLQGAAALAAQLGTSVRRVHAVDTFVSSDSPLESHRYAFTPLGAGPVIRALDGSSVAPPHEVIRIESVARRHGIPVQVGTTSGGNDGSALAKFGAVNIPLSWPGRYSHSPVEVADLRDIAALTRLIIALAREPAGPR